LAFNWLRLPQPELSFWRVGRFWGFRVLGV